jgi:hypothetical protein
VLPSSAATSARYRHQRSWEGAFRVVLFVFFVGFVFYLIGSKSVVVRPVLAFFLGPLHEEGRVYSKERHHLCSFRFLAQQIVQVTSELWAVSYQFGRSLFLALHDNTAATRLLRCVWVLALRDGAPGRGNHIVTSAIAVGDNAESLSESKPFYEQRFCE